MKIYYTININISTNGNFKFEDEEYKINEDCKKVFYFKTREDAINSVKRSYNNIEKTLKCVNRNENKIKDTLREFKPWFSKVCRKVPIFDISIQKDESEINYRLGKIKVFESSDNKDVLYESLSCTTLRLNIMKDWKTDYNWYSIDRVPDAID